MSTPQAIHAHSQVAQVRMPPRAEIKVLEPSLHHSTTSVSPLLERLQEAAVDELRVALAWVGMHPVCQAVRNSPNLRLQEFFGEQDVSFGRGELVKPIFFSAREKSIVISLPDLRAYLMPMIERNKGDEASVLAELKMFAANRNEFAVHEYGHIAAINGAIVADPSEKDLLASERATLMNLLRSFPNTEIAFARVPHILSDLRAEVFRRDVDLGTTERDVESFGKMGVIERVLPDAPLRCHAFNVDSILRMLVWYPICRAMGPEGYAEKVIDEVCRSCAEIAPACMQMALHATDYFEHFMDSREFQEAKLLQALTRM